MAFRIKNWFFTTTSTSLRRGTRLKNGDRPNESTMKDLLESTVFKSEINDKAKEDVGSFSPERNGHVTLATSEQVKSHTSQKLDRSLVVQPDQVSQVTTNDTLSAPDYTGPTLVVEIDPNTVRRNNYVVKLTNGFKTWLADFKTSFLQFVEAVTPRLLPTGGETGDVLIKTGNSNFDVGWGGVPNTFLDNLSYQVTQSLENDVDIVTVIDTTGSMGSYVNTISTQMQEWFDVFKKANPWYQGNFYVHLDGTERWVAWPQWYGVNEGRTKVMMVAFCDETNDRYHSNLIGNIATEGTTAQYRTDFDNFVSVAFPQFNFFKGILYAVPSAVAPSSILNERAAFHGHIYKAVTKGTVPVGSFIESPLVVLAGSSLSFIETFNPYAATTGSQAAHGTYDGLVDYGWAEIHDFGISDINSKLTKEEFDTRIQNTLFGITRENIFTVQTIATLTNGNTVTAYHQVKVPVSPTPFDQYKNLPNPINTSQVNALPDGELYYLTAAQIWGAGNAPGAILQDNHKILFVKNV